MLNLKKYSYLTTQKIVHAGFSLFTLFLILFIFFFFTKCAHSVYTNTLQQISGVHVLYYSYPTLVIAEQPSTCL